MMDRLADIEVILLGLKRQFQGQKEGFKTSLGSALCFFAVIMVGYRGTTHYHIIRPPGFYSVNIIWIPVASVMDHLQEIAQSQTALFLITCIQLFGFLELFNIDLILRPSACFL